MKRHRCDVPGCGKLFSRPSHLQRHALNHSNTQWVCERCNAGFKRLDLLERHKARHASRDKGAGGVGLGVLETKRKHLLSLPGSERTSNSSQQSSSQQLPSPPTSRSQATDVHLTTNHDNTHASSSPPGQGNQPQNELQELPMTDLNTEYFDPQLHFANSALSPSMYHVMAQSPRVYDIGNMYHDMTFDLVHFNVTGFTPQQVDDHILIHSTNCDAPANNPNNVIRDEVVSGDSGSQENIPNQREVSTITTGEGLNGFQTCGQYRGVDASVIVTAVTDTTAQDPLSPTSQPGNSHNASGDCGSSNPVIDQHSHRTDGEWAGGVQTAGPATLPKTRKHPLVSISNEKRAELLEFIAKIRPVRPNGTLIDGDYLDFSLENMHTYLDLFLEYFNTSYPLVHVATLEVQELDPIALLSFIILGATYDDKYAHQLSVCLYDAIIPYILSGLLSSPVPDLAILQAFLVLECYGMYRAGPYQRENAILIHCLLLNSIRRISRYHVRARITLPDRLTHGERDWLEFAYTEQYKRLILFFFIWDTQNASCYSFMPNMSTQSLHLSLPCSKELWEATNEAEWRDVLTQHKEPYTLLTLVKQFVSADHKMLSKPYDMLSFTLALYGLMAMCNDIILFDNRAIYLGELKSEDSSVSSWSPGRQQMAYALSSWKAKFDAFAMETIAERKAEPFQSDFRRDNMALFALYHTAHIVLNCEIRHLQTAAGAKAIFGHIVTPSDYEDSCKWVRQWVRNSLDSAGHAAWHAAQLFHEGMLNLKNWEVHGVFHYPWCLYIATLTCWAFHNFGAETSSLGPACDHSSPAKAEELHRSSKGSMHYLVAAMASVTPAYIDGLIGMCCTHSLAIKMAKYLRGVRWTAAYEAMKILEGLSGIPP